MVPTRWKCIISSVTETTWKCSLCSVANGKYTIFISGVIKIIRYTFSNISDNRLIIYLHICLICKRLYLTNIDSGSGWCLFTLLTMNNYFWQYDSKAHLKTRSKDIDHVATEGNDPPPSSFWVVMLSKGGRFSMTF